MNVNPSLAVSGLNESGWFDKDRHSEDRPRERAGMPGVGAQHANDPGRGNGSLELVGQPGILEQNLSLELDKDFNRLA
ncbi:MAG: hypothetical protein M1816_005180 [Peltula sp. TS41687]|nr:MAG: hypothetical protein M1816_005180 [Peltula sp. TS41687]